MSVVKLEYIWIDADGGLRAKTRLHTKEFSKPEDLPEWSYDGSSTKQAKTGSSDVLLKPVAIFKDPFRGDPHKLVLCEIYKSDGSPHPDNHRKNCVEIMEKYKDQRPWFGMEQEYILFSRETKPYKWNDGTNDILYECQVPYMWIDHNNPGKQGGQGVYYCSVGGGTAFGREIAETHLDKCIEAGVKICGINAEVMPSQWEFQIGICEGIEMGDHLWIARYILYRVSESFGVDVSLHPKPYKGDWNGSGLHTNYSLESMREGETAYESIKKACEALCKQDRHDLHMKVYGLHNNERMLGSHETASFTSSNFGESDRSKSIRIPLGVTKDKKGYLEDRRVASNADPYEVSAIIVETTCQ